MARDSIFPLISQGSRDMCLKVMAEQNKIYQPLIKAKREVRLMRMNYDDVEGIDCRLRTISLDDASEILGYRALSYCWTQDPATCCIRLNGERFKVRPNLYEYLKILHAEDDGEWIFIDALCINQRDLEEQSSQISLMGEVYRNAREVVAWLGVDFAYDTIPFLTPTGRMKVKSIMLLLEHEAILHNSRWLDAIPADLDLDVVMLCFECSFFKRSYWSRSWIVQEIVLARVLLLQFKCLRIGAELMKSWIEESRVGFGSMDLDPVDTIFIRQMRLLWGEYRYRRHNLFGKLNNLRQRLQSNNQCSYMSFRSAIMLTAGQECSRLSDHVFGLLGLTKSHLTPDYTMPRIELYLRALFEGLLEQLYVRYEHTVEIFGDRDESAWPIFAFSLMFALDLSPWHPIVAFTTGLVIRFCWYTDYCSYWIMAQIYHLFTPLSRKDKLASSCSRPWSVVLSARLTWCDITKRSITAPGDTAAETLVNWTKTVQEMCIDVVNQMQDARRLDGATADLLRQEAYDLK